MTVEIRKERPEDYSAIYTVTELAFKGMPYASGDESAVVDRLREANAHHPNPRSPEQ